MARATLDAAQAVISAGGSAAVASAGGAMVPDLLRLRAAHIDLPQISSPMRARYTLPRRIVAGLLAFDVTVIQSRTPATALVARAVSRRLETRWIATLHRPFSTRGLMARLVERRQAYADALIAVSGHIARDALKHFPDIGERLHTIPPGINFDRFDPAIVRADRVIRLAGELRVPDGSHLVLCPARFSEDGGQKVLVEAIKRLGRSDVFCLLLGSSGTPTPFEQELEQAIERAEMNGRVQIGPYVEDMPAAYMLADVVVATGGPNQGFSRTMVEAQAMGRPVVAEDGGGAAEAVRPDVTGWLAPAGNPAVLAQAIAQALSLSVERRAELARAGQEHVRGRFAQAHSNQQMLRLYERLSN
jgi:glycosyltransferase involved in cell wall biosynthesis